MRLFNTLVIVTPMIFFLSACPMTIAVDGDDDDSTEGGDDNANGDDDDSASAIVGDVSVFIERDCDDMRDNDRDEYTDCSDSDCHEAPDCNGF